MKKLVSKSLLTIAGASLLIIPISPFRVIAAQGFTAPRIDRYIQDLPNGLKMMPLKHRGSRHWKAISNDEAILAYHLTLFLR